MAELKRCPFCGGEAAFLGTTCTIKCKQCGEAFIATNPVVARMEIAAAWNRRVNEAGHGRKIEDGDIGCFWLCSLCGECLPYGANYCPNCGAKMDGGVRT